MDITLSLFFTLLTGVAIALIYGFCLFLVDVIGDWYVDRRIKKRIKDLDFDKLDFEGRN